MLTKWYPDHPPIYDISKTYVENLEQGPFFEGKIPLRNIPLSEKWVDFLGHPVASSIGVPAGPLLSSAWVALAGKLGFDILVYKTIRSSAHPCHPLPNMVYVRTDGTTASLSSAPTENIEELAVTNSFGMPSMSPEFLREDIPRAMEMLSRGQVLVVSVVGSVRSGCTFLDDFAAAARLAKEAGAPIIEANFSCPNVDLSAGSVYMSPQAVFDIGSAIVKAIAPLPLIIKVGLFSSPEQMRAVFHAAAKAGIRAISGINTVRMAVVDRQGLPVLGKERKTSGICGGPIRKRALHFVESAAEINRADRLDFTLIGVGGITTAEHFNQFLSAGADVAMSATGMMWDPYLGLRYHSLKEDS